MAKSKQKKTLKTNAFCGKPGTDEFRCKLPKYITIESIYTVLHHLLKHDIGHAALEEEQIEYLTGELKLIYANLNEEIARHYSTIAIQNGRHHFSRTIGTNITLFDNTLFDISINRDQSSSPDRISDNITQTSPIVMPDSHNAHDKDFSPSAPLRCLQNLELKITHLTKELNDLRAHVNAFTRDNNERAHSVAKGNNAPASPIAEQQLPVQCPSVDEQLRAYRDKHKVQHASLDTHPQIVIPQKTDLLIVGDSMTRSIVPSRLSRRRRVLCKSLPGARIEDAFEATSVAADQHQPEEILLHLGTNNLPHDDDNEVIAKLASLAEQIVEKTAASSITLSSIIHHANETAEAFTKVNDVNQGLKLLANEHGWSFIDNSNIDPRSHLTIDGVHLNGPGIRVLAQNIITHIRGNSRSTIEPIPTTSHGSPSFLQQHHQKFRRRPKGRVFPRDWLESLETARRLLNSDS